MDDSITVITESIYNGSNNDYNDLDKTKKRVDDKVDNNLKENTKKRVDDKVDNDLKENTKKRVDNNLKENTKKRVDDKLDDKVDNDLKENTKKRVDDKVDNDLIKEKIYAKTDPINNNLIIDVAVLCHEYVELEKLNNDHIIILDDIRMTLEMFQSIYYAHGENFAMDKKFITKKNIQPYISFLPEHRTINKQCFCLLEQLFLNIEQDLNVSRDCFTIESKVELSNEISSIRYIYDLNASALLSSLTWTNIMEIIKNYKLVNCNKKEMHFIFVISVVFKTPTPGVKNTIVRFNYMITNI
jgi:hypothetical protein